MKNLDIDCSQCHKRLAAYDAASDSHCPTPEELMAAGAVAIPNFGWFCSQPCATLFEQKAGRKLFDRNAKGDVQYY